MSKNKNSSGFGKAIVLAAVAGAAAAGISYFTKYKSFHKELEEDFRDFEDEGDASEIDSTMNRNYVALHADKDEFKVAASDMADAAKDAAGAAKNLVKDAASIVADTAQSAMMAATDTAQSVMVSAREKINSVREAGAEEEEDITGYGIHPESTEAAAANEPANDTTNTTDTTTITEDDSIS